jgi:hypothetical protein
LVKRKKKKKKVDPAPSAAFAARQICDNDFGVDFFEELRRACHFRWSVQFQVGGGAAETKQKRVVKLIITKHSANKRERESEYTYKSQPQELYSSAARFSIIEGETTASCD